MVTYEEVTTSTPNGGVRYCAYFRDIDDEPTTKEAAQSIEIIEYDAQDEIVGRTYLTKNKKTPTDEVALAFNEKDHPRRKAGQEGGGQFVARDDSSADRPMPPMAKKKKKPTTESGAESTEAPEPELTDVPSIPTPQGEPEIITNDQGLKVMKAVSGKKIPGVIAVYDVEKPVDIRVLKGEKAPPEVHKKVLEKAKEKAATVPEPSAEDKAKAEAGCNTIGANAYRKKLNGNVYDRERRRKKKIEEFAPIVKEKEVTTCVYCGAYIGDNVSGSIELDKIIPTRPGGKYTMENTLPACKPCNNARGDMSFEEALEILVTLDPSLSLAHRGKSITLPPDGTYVTAMFLGSILDDLEPQEIEGKLTTYSTPFGVACMIDGWGVDPNTVRAVKEYEEEEKKNEASFAISRQIGEKWQGKSGRWFTRNQDGHVVPFKNPGNEGQPQQHQPQAQPQQPTQRSQPNQVPQQSTPQTSQAQPKQPQQPQQAAQQAAQQARQGIIQRILGLFGSNRETPPPGPDFQEIHKLSLSERMDHAPARDALIQKLEGDPKRQRNWETLGQQVGGDATHAKKVVQEKIQQLINGCSMYSRVGKPEVMMKILEGGFKNQFQTGTSTAIHDPKGRAIAELRSMGTPMDTPPEQRPMYGYMSDGSIHPDSEMVRKYGNFIVKMKPDLRQRSTVSMGDSWNGSSNDYFAASPLDEMDHNSINPEALVNVGIDSLDSFEAFNEKHRTYIEAQVHGGIAPTDIESVQIRGEPSPALRQKLEELKIPWSSY